MLASQYKAAIHLTIPGVNLNGLHRGITVFTPIDLAIQHVVHAPKERCDSAPNNGWRPQDSIKQNVVVGCGDIGQPSPRHNKLDGATMYDAWEYCNVHGRDLPFAVAGVSGFIESYVVADREGKLLHVLQESNTWGAYLNVEFARWTGFVRVFDGNYYKLRLGDSVEKRVIPRVTPVRSHRASHMSMSWGVFSWQDCDVAHSD